VFPHHSRSDKRTQNLTAQRGQGATRHYLTRSLSFVSKAFQPHLVMSRDVDLYVHAEAGNAGAKWTDSAGKIFQFDPVPNLVIRWPAQGPVAMRPAIEALAR